MPLSFSEDKNYSHKIQLLEEAANDAFAVLTQFETTYPERSFSELLRSLPEETTSTEPIKPETEGLLHIFREKMQKKMALVFGSDHLFSVVVYFMPGTSEPIPLYFSGKSKWSDLIPGEDKMIYGLWMKERIDQIAEDLKHGFMPRVEDNKAKHFFYCAYIQAKVMAAALCKGRNVPDQLTSGPGGFSAFTVWADPLQSGKFALCLKDAEDNGKNRTIEWDGYEALDRPPMLSSPIFVNDNSLVLMASYFERQYFESLLSNASSFRRLLGLHGLFARQVFGGVFTSILRGDMSTLRRNLGRYHISPSLLKETACYLIPKRTEDGREKVFTYEWEVSNLSNTQKLNCADLRAHLYGDIIKEPEKTTTRVLEVQKSIYKKMLISSNMLPGFGLPKENMPLAGVLESLEEAQRALHTKKRDHIIHQFQVFLLGTLIINKYQDKFLNAMAYSSRATIGVELDKNDPRTFDLLKIAWFLCATLHDVGYPVQDIDGFVTTLRGSVAKLLNLPAFRLDVPPRLRIDQVLYDDPRAYVLLRKMTERLIEWSKVGNFETWWYFIRQLTFNEKHHALASALALGLACLPPPSSTTSYSALDSAGFGLFLTRHVLLPIAMHHAYDWCENVKSIKTSYQSGMDNGHATEQDREQAKIALAQFTSAIDPIKSFLEENPGKHLNNILSFDEFPLAVLLAICDFVQESGRSSGSRKPEWPAGVSDEVKCGSSREDLFQIAVEMQYDGNEKSLCEKDLKDRLQKVDRLRSLYEVSCLDDLLCVVICGQHSNGWIADNRPIKILSGPGKILSRCVSVCKRRLCSGASERVEPMKNAW